MGPGPSPGPLCPACPTAPFSTRPACPRLGPPRPSSPRRSPRSRPGPGGSPTPRDPRPWMGLLPPGGPGQNSSLGGSGSWVAPRQVRPWDRSGGPSAAKDLSTGLKAASGRGVLGRARHPRRPHRLSSRRGSGLRDASSNPALLQGHRAHPASLSQRDPVTSGGGSGEGTAASCQLGPSPDHTGICSLSPAQAAARRRPLTPQPGQGPREQRAAPSPGPGTLGPPPYPPPQPDSESRGFR